MSENHHTQPSQKKYAGFFIRLLAYIVDVFILFAIESVIRTLLGSNPFDIANVRSVAELRAYETKQDSFTLFSYLFTAIFIVGFWVNYKGATPGKKLVGIRIQKIDGKPITYLTGITRLLGYIISWFVFGIGFFAIWWDPKKRGWHDKIAGTEVVYTKEKRYLGIAIALAVIGICVFTYLMEAMYTRTAKVENANTSTSSSPVLEE